MHVYVSVYAYVYLSVCIHLHVGVCEHMEARFTSFFVTGSLIEPGTFQFALTDWPASLCDPPTSAFLGLWLRVHTTVSGFFYLNMNAGYSDSELHAQPKI